MSSGEHYEVYTDGENHFAALVQGDVRVRVHPIPFYDKRDADRAVARLNQANGFSA